MELRQALLTFLIGCIGFRLFLAFLAKQSNKKWLRFMGYLALLPVFGFTFLFITGTRKYGPEAAGGKIWWNGLRPLHALLYAVFAYFAIRGNRNAWIYLFADAMLGLFSFLWFHSRNGDFSKAFL